MLDSVNSLAALEKEHAAILETQAKLAQSVFPEMQVKAFDTFKSLGFPTTKNEDWRYTNLKKWSESTLSVNLAEAVCLEDYSDLYAQATGFLDTYDLVFAGGIFVDAWSALETFPEGVNVTQVQTLEGAQKELVASAIQKEWHLEKHGLNVLNEAFLSSIVCVDIAREIVLDKPLRVLHLMHGREHNRAVYPRLVLRSGSRSKSTLIEHFVGHDQVHYFTNNMVDLFVEESAELKHIRIQCEGNLASHFSGLNVEQLGSSVYRLFSLALGSQIVRNDVLCALAGKESFCTLDGLYVLGGSEHVDNFTTIEHQKEHTRSREFYKGVVGGKGNASFSGKVYVHSEAQQTDAAQTNRNLLLSKNASANTKPQLEIYADDVKCAHGATVGQLDDDALFYLRSRGIDKEEAKRQLIMAFTNEVVDACLEGSLKDYVEDLVVQRLNEYFAAQEQI